MTFTSRVHSLLNQTCRVSKSDFFILPKYCLIFSTKSPIIVFAIRSNIFRRTGSDLVSKYFNSCTPIRSSKLSKDKHLTEAINFFFSKPIQGVEDFQVNVILQGYYYSLFFNLGSLFFVQVGFFTSFGCLNSFLVRRSRF